MSLSHQRQRLFAQPADASPDQSAIFGLGSAIGFARYALHSLAVLHCDLPTAIRNQSLFSEGLPALRLGTRETPSSRFTSIKLWRVVAEQTAESALEKSRN